MRKLKLLFVVLSILAIGCSPKQKQESTETMNPFFQAFNTPFEVPAFASITLEHYEPAFVEGMRRQKEAIQAIIDNPDAPNFTNTIEAIDYSGEMLTIVSNVFSNQLSADTNDSLQAIAQRVMPMLSKHADDIALNPQLFERIKVVYEQKDQLGLNVEQLKLLTDQYRDFVRGGANLKEESKERFRAINEELSTLSLQFGDNQLKDGNAYQLFIEEADITGLPESVKAAAADAANEARQAGKYLITLDKPSFIPFLTYSDRRDLREKVLKAYNHIGDNNNEFDNKEIAKKLTNLRLERATILGYPTHADYVLEDNMAKNPANVYKLLDQIWTKALPNAKKEVGELQKIADKEGAKIKIEAWDWWYYAEKLRKEKYDLDEEMLRPYFELGRVQQGAFDLATKLYGITFEKRTDIPVYHPEATAYEVKESTGDHIGILMMDFHPRASKSSGAWMSSYRDQYMKNGQNITPIITVVCNFSKPAGGKPALLTFEEVETLFHEFGHALHGLLSNCTYPSQAGTSVPRDFVELPSQVMENWCAEPEMLKMFGIHYETGEVIPDALIQKITESSHFNQGFITVEFMSAAYLDMAYQTLTSPLTTDVNSFETAAMTKIGLIPEIVVRYRSTYFSHIFAGGYSAGYYAYLWSEMLDADAFEAFKETSLFDKETATRFRYQVISRGGTDDPMEMYKRFRGKEPQIEPLLKRKGIL